MNLKKNITLATIIIIVIILIVIGISYAYFTANLTGGEDATTITVTGGTMNIIYNGGADINIANIIPDDDPAATKVFTVTGNNTTDINMDYQLNFIIESNSFSEEALKFKLISTNNDNNGTVAPNITDLTNIGSESKTINLGTGSFTSPTEGNKVHTYNLQIYFLNTEYNQNENQGKEFKSHIEITNNFGSISLQGVILAQDGGAAVIEAKGSPNFANISTSADTGLYASADEYGTSYYYRGVKNNLNNNLIFGGFQWKIVRINGDGSIRIIYNGTEGDFTLSGMMNTTGVDTQIGTHAWSTNYNDAKYAGYMYGGNNGVASTSRNGITETSATYNQTSSNAKAQLDSWYETNIAGKPFEEKLVDNLFCNDRQLQSEVGGVATGPGYGSATTLYAPYHRLFTNKTPTLKCGLKNDRFTQDDNVVGNTALTYPVGLITADEAAMAGIVIEIDNTTNYLYTNQGYWTLSPIAKVSEMESWFVNYAGYLNFTIVDSMLGLRPVINISSETTVTGVGSATNPFIVTI